jgi:adenine-specific DNA methylase
MENPERLSAYLPWWDESSGGCRALYGVASTMSNGGNIKTLDLFGNVVDPDSAPGKKGKRKNKADTRVEHLPEKLGKAIRLPVPDFSDPNRKPTCLEEDFPIAQINALSNLEGNAGKPIYQMSKWWARRRSSVFRSMLIAAATEAPDDPHESAKIVWDHYYCNHQKAGSFKKLRVLDPFMGGGTTLVEGSRLGMQMTGVDLNPVAWFVVKNELACSDPEQVQALFDHIEAEVKPQIQPFYTTTCPRGHKGRWLDVHTGEPVDIDPLELEPEARSRYCWEGPEVIYTFWAKHGPCQAKGCGHRTPIFRTPVIAEKKLSTFYIELTCPDCGQMFHAELGETRMAPGSERVVLEEETPFTEMTQDFAQLLKDYDKGKGVDTFERMLALKGQVDDERGMQCPACGTFAGKMVADILKKHDRSSLKASQRKKKDFGILRKSVQMYLLIHPEWLKGASGFDGDKEMGGWAGASAVDTARWFERRMENLALIEVRGKSLPDEVKLLDWTVINTKQGTVPKKATFTCASCGREGNTLKSIKQTGHTALVAAYTLQCYCPQCEAEGYNYGGRYFKAADVEDIRRLKAAETEWIGRCDTDLKNYWPKVELWVSYMTHKLNGGIANWGYTHWWKMFNSRQLLVQSQLLKSISEAPENEWHLDIREQALGIFQQYLRNQNMFIFWNPQRDTPEPMFSNANYHPKMHVIENCVFNNLGRGNWQSSSAKCIDALNWSRKPWELVAAENGITKSEKGYPDDPIVSGNEFYCGSSTDLSNIGDDLFDFVITDPPFGNNLFYADLADFFYVWLRLPLQKWYMGLPEEQYFKLERTPHSMEAIDNSVEHPDDREEYEKSPLILGKHLKHLRELTEDNELQENAPNPLYRPEPSSDFYSQTLSACWAESGRLLKDGGIMAFTFHHNEDRAWIDILKALFDAGYVLVATYPIRSDETKGKNAAFGSRKIEYDIIHVCRKRLEEPQPVSWARMRRWVKSESRQLKELLEHTHGKELPESDLRVILRGKSLEFYSRHYGKVFTGEGQVLDVRDALLGINQLLDDLLEDTSETGGQHPPDIAEPASRLYLRIFRNREQIPRDELHKTLRGTGISQGDLESRGWIRVEGKVVYVAPISERFDYFTAPGRNRKVIKTDLDQAHFLIGAAFQNSGVKIENELNNPNFRIKKSVDEILKWYQQVGDSSEIHQSARTALQLVKHWRTRRIAVQSTLFDTLEAEE